MAAVTAEARPPRTGEGRTDRRRFVRLLVGWIVILLLLVGWAVTLRPTQLGGPATFIVVSGDSMEPILHSGDLVVLRTQDTYEIGDVVTFPVPDGEPGAGSLVIHRIVDTEGQLFIPQGDNRSQADEWRPTNETVRGSLWFHVPRAGQVLTTVLQPPLIAALAGGAVTVWLLMREPNAKGRKKKNADPN